ncbi:MAG TPA: TusE/DsrC/DsvC family sulfur relay protein [Desulfosporosinus sp.]|nr:TusE/DsrC/DsvC family sulfur relay protein [Desulfosporosinus sp.]
MSQLIVGSLTIELDEDGFLEDAMAWNEDVARALAETEEIEELTEEHWKMINYLRGYYEQFGVAPMVRKIIKDSGFDQKKIYELFPAGPGKGACKISGLPKPTGCV